MELHQVCSEDKPSLRQWLQSEQNYTHPALHPDTNEIIQIIENEMFANFTKKINVTNTQIYSVICDGVQDRCV